MKFKLKSNYQPAGDQPEAIKKLTDNLTNNHKSEVLLGVTGSGKTYTIASVIENVQKPTLVISHNKTLAAQLYQEFRDFFPDNAVSYFVSYYDYYQPEAYIPQTDTYIEKETEINEEIDKLRLAATTNLLTRRDSIVIASVSCIYNLGSPLEYGKYILELRPGGKLKREQIMTRLLDLQYERNDYGFKRGSFRLRGETMDIFPAYTDYAVKIEFLENIINKISYINPLTGDVLDNTNQATVIYPAKHYMTDPSSYKSVFSAIRNDLAIQVDKLRNEGHILEAQRIKQRTEYDLEMITELGYVNGIENYSRYFDGRKPGDAPYSLMDYFPKDYLLVIDESHITIPQIRGMYNGDQARKKTLIDFGFRLPSALDNRPLKFTEFMQKINQTIYVSATPNDYELSLSLEENKNNLVEQLVRPTGLIDPEVFIKPVDGQIKDLICEIKLRINNNERTLVTTLTKKMAEDLSAYLEQEGIKVSYLHSDIVTLKRQDVLDKLRTGEFDVIVGINLLREGLDLPEVSLVVILDADKEGFLRSKSSLIQVMGRCARNINSKVIMYADKVTKSMQGAIDEVTRRRKIQIKYNIKNSIEPKSIIKPVRNKLVENNDYEVIDLNLIEQLTPKDKKLLKTDLRKKMLAAAQEMNFELAAKIRDKIKTLG